jgi:hypothetical protein
MSFNPLKQLRRRIAAAIQDNVAAAARLAESTNRLSFAHANRGRYDNGHGKPAVSTLWSVQDNTNRRYGRS